MTMKRHLVTVLLITAVCRQGVAAADIPPSTARDQAAFLAGLSLPTQNPLSRLQQSPEYREHQKQLQEEWTFCRRIRYEAMQQWGREHVGNEPSARNVLRYLFGGPDFLNAYAFFPDTRVMVLGGLEPVGEVPPPEALNAQALAPALKALREALHTSLFCGYFITSEMKPQLAKGSFQGVLPVLYTELALTGNLIQSVQMVRPFGSPGVEIVYRRSGGPEQTLYYFKADLSNGKECRNFLGWLRDLGAGCTYLKAASYLLPLDAFSETRNFLLNTSELILQDDSGIPYRDFKPGQWRIRLFGAYTDPLPIFKLRREPELETAYRTRLFGGGLPFGVGYHVNANDANLLLAVRGNGREHAAADALEIPVTAPPAVAAFSAPTPKPLPIPIRKALPVPIRKAIPVRTPKPKKAVVSLQSVIRDTQATTSPPPQQAMPVPSRDDPAGTPLSEEAPAVEVAPAPAVEVLPLTPAEPPPPPPPPATSDGKPID